MLFWKYIFKLLKENVQKVSRPICYCGLIVTYLQVYHEKSKIQLSLLAHWIPEREYYRNMSSQDQICYIPKLSALSTGLNYFLIKLNGSEILNLWFIWLTTLSSKYAGSLPKNITNFTMHLACCKIN